jgi:polyisoprenoid-binding protein YceI
MRVSIVIAALIAAAVASIPPPSSAVQPVVRGVASSRFTGSSTLHDFSGTAAPAGFTVEPGSDGSWSAVVDVPVDSLTTDNDTRDRRMRQMFQATEHPMLRGEFGHIVPEEVRTSSRLPFRLTIAGVSRDITSSVRDWRESENRLDFVADFDISLSDFGLEAPRVFVVVVADAVHVTTEVSLKRE